MNYKYKFIKKIILIFLILISPLILFGGEGDDPKPPKKYKHYKENKFLTTKTGMLIGGTLLLTAGYLGNTHGTATPFNGHKTFIPMNPNQMAMVMGSGCLIIGIVIKF